MRQYITQAVKIEEVKKVEKIVCNKCGKIIIVRNEIAEEEVLHIEKRWGYFSEKDNEVHEFDLCESCYDQMIAEFLIPVKKE